MQHLDILRCLQFKLFSEIRLYTCVLQNIPSPITETLINYVDPGRVQKVVLGCVRKTDAQIIIIFVWQLLNWGRRDGTGRPAPVETGSCSL